MGIITKLAMSKYKKGLRKWKDLSIYDLINHKKFTKNWRRFLTYLTSYKTFMNAGIEYREKE